METYNIEHYIITVETTQTTKPGDNVNVTIKSARPDSKYASVYSLLMYPDDSAELLARRAYAHYKMGTRPNERVLVQRGIIDETGCERYTMNLDQLNDLYKRLEKFVADCTQQEYNENKAAITAVYTLMHKHINNEIYK